MKSEGEPRRPAATQAYPLLSIIPGARSGDSDAPARPSSQEPADPASVKFPSSFVPEVLPWVSESPRPEDALADVLGHPARRASRARSSSQGSCRDRSPSPAQDAPDTMIYFPRQRAPSGCSSRRSSERTLPGDSVKLTSSGSRLPQNTMTPQPQVPYSLGGFEPIEGLQDALSNTHQSLNSLVGQLHQRLHDLEDDDGKSSDSKRHRPGFGSSSPSTQRKPKGQQDAAASSDSEEQPPRKKAVLAFGDRVRAEPEDAIDAAILGYLERNPGFPVSVNKLAPHHYVFGDRGTVFLTKRGHQVLARVGGGYKKLKNFMDERALMVNSLSHKDECTTVSS